MMVTIREMKDSDLDAVLALYAQPEMDDGTTLDKSDALAMLRRIESYPFYRYYVAVSRSEEGAQPEGESVIGVFALLIMENLGHQGASSGVVEGVCVDPSMQGQGVGQSMMEAAIKVCRDRGCYKVSLSSNKRREGAHAFYRHLGFEQHGLSFHIDL